MTGWKPPRPQRRLDGDVSRTQHGLSSDAVKAMYARQRGKCLVCALPKDIEDLVVEHDHAIAAMCGHDVNRGCGKCIRALACSRCNTILGLAHDDSDLLRRAATYIDLARRNTVLAREVRA